MRRAREQRLLSGVNAGRLVTVLSLVTIFALTLYPTRGRTAEWTCIFCGTFALADTIVNVLLFMPLGAGLAMMRIQLRRSLIIAVLVPVAIEFAQSVIPGRDASIGDLISNSVGYALGYGAIVLAVSHSAASRKRASLLSLVAAAIVVCVVAATGVLLQASFPQSRYYPHWTPDFDHMAWYRGEVLDARIGSLELPPHQLEWADSFRNSWFEGSPIRIRAVTGPSVSALAPLFSISDHREREILLIGLDRTDLVFSYRTLAISRRLHQPALRIPNAIVQDPGDTVTIVVWRDGDRHHVTVNADSHRNLGFTAGKGWSLLIASRGFSAGATMLLNAFWLLALMLPVGFWTRASPASVGPLLIAVFGLAVVPHAVGLLTTPVTEWIGAATGYGIGAWLGALTRRAQDQESARRVPDAALYAAERAEEEPIL